MNTSSSLGPYGIGVKFYQCCFDIIKKDLLADVKCSFVVKI